MALQRETWDPEREEVTQGRGTTGIQGSVECGLEKARVLLQEWIE